MGIIRETDLPGIGKKFQIEARSGDKMVIVIHDDGRRELYQFADDDPDESVSLVTLEDDEARQVAAIIGGMSYKPKHLETIEMSLKGLVIEWYRVESHYKAVGKTIADLQVRHKTGATILAIVDKDNQKINPGPQDMITSECTLVIAGEREQLKLLKELIMHGTLS